MPDSGQFPLFYAFQLRLEGIFFCPRPRHEAFVFLPAAGAWSSAPNLLTKVPAFLKTGELAAGAWTFIFLPTAGAWGSAPNLLTKVPAFFENGGTRPFHLQKLVVAEENRN